MPRKRKHDPSIPGHIDQRKLPVGCYWNRRDRNWYTLRNGKRSKPIASADALLSDLHKALELAKGTDSSMLDHMLGKFEDSSQFKTEISENTRTDYRYCRDVLQRHQTKLGVPFADLRRGSITPPLIQRLVNDIAKDFPAKANHVKRYLSVAYQWGVLNGYAETNVAQGVRQAKEKKAHRMPEADTARAVIDLLRARGAMPSRREGSLAPYIWAVAEIAYRCRMRGVEVRNLTDANRTDAGIIVVRVKGSDGNLTTWCPELSEAWSWLVSRRARIWLKKPALRAKATRPLVVAEDGSALSKSALNSAWRRAMAAAIKAGLISEASRFGLHGLKHRGVTDTDGGKAKKKEASGHKTDAMLNLYDHEIPTVKPAGKRD